MSKYVCCLCGKTFEGFGNNPWPLAKGEDDRCCDECNNKVIIARLANLGGKKHGESESRQAVRGADSSGI